MHVTLAEYRIQAIDDAGWGGRMFVVTSLHRPLRPFLALW